MTLRPGTEQRLLDAAEELFFTRGIAATPVDAVLERAGVSTATLYRGYATKEALVAAALERRQSDWLATWDDVVDRASDDHGRLLAVFDALDEYRSRPAGSRWCAFLGAASEHADAPPELAEVLAAESASLRTRLAALAEPLVGDDRATDVAEQLTLVVTGALAMRLRDATSGTTAARAVAEAVLASAQVGRPAPGTGRAR